MAFNSDCLAGRSAPGGYYAHGGFGEEGEDKLDTGYSNLDLVNEEDELDPYTRAQTLSQSDRNWNNHRHLSLAPEPMPRKSVPTRDLSPVSAQQKKISLDLPIMRGRLTAQSSHAYGRSPGAKRKVGSAGISRQHTIAAPSSGVVVRRTIECSVCYEPFGDVGEAVPRSLECGHSFCTGCLQKWSRSLKISCPKCTQVTTLNMYGVNKLMRNFTILEVIYSGGPQAPVELPDTETSEISGPSEALPTPAVRLCEEHGDHLTSFCMKDKVFVCSSCLLYGKHKQHPCKLVRDAALDCRQFLAALTPDVVTQRKKMLDAVERVSKEMEEVKNRTEQLDKDVDEHFDELVGVLNARRKELKMELLERGQIRVEALLQQLQSLHKVISTCDDCATLCSELNSSDEVALLLRYSEAQRKIEEVFTNPPSSTPCARSDLRMEFPAGTAGELEGQLGGYGLRSEVGTVQHLFGDSYHNGFRVHWQGHNYVDSQGISYAVQVAKDDQEFITVYRGGETKYTWRPNTIEDHVFYKFRVRVQTTDGVGNWSESVSCRRKPPLFRWHTNWRNVKIELSPEKLEAWSTSSSHKHKYWSTLAGDILIREGQHYFEIELVKISQKTSPKIALGVITLKNGALPSSINWQEGKHPIGHSALFSSTSPSFLPQQQQHSNEDYSAWSYLPSDGKKLSTFNKGGLSYGDIPPLQNDDRIGMLISVREGTISFFLNGQDLGVAFTNLVPPLLPAVSICDKAHIRLMFPPPPYLKRNPRLTLFSVSSSTDLL